MSPCCTLQTRLRSGTSRSHRIRDSIQRGDIE
jgi:hypothetical protein